MDAPAVAVSRDGKTIAAAWMDMRAGTNNRDVQWTVGMGGKFPPETTVNDDSAGIQGHPSLTITPDGTVWCAWEDGRSGPNAQRIFVSDSVSKKNRPLSAEGEGKCGYATLISRGGFVGAIYETSSGVSFRPILAP